MAAEARLVVNELVQMTNYAWGTPVTWTRLVYDGRQRLRVRQEYTWQDTATNPGPESLTLGLGGRGAAALARPGGGSSPWQLASETRYIYDGMRVIQERDANNVPVVSYTRGTDLGGSLEGAGGIGGLLARSHGYSGGSWTTHNDYHADGNGNVTYLVDSSQGLAASYRYDAYGNTLAASGSLATANEYRFSSKEVHVLTGLYYYGYRWYAPDLQRWVNRDPIREKGFNIISQRFHTSTAQQWSSRAPLGEVDGVSLFGFVDNSPVDLVDSFGLRGCSTLKPLLACWRQEVYVTAAAAAVVELCTEGLTTGTWGCRIAIAALAAATADMWDCWVAHMDPDSPCPYGRPLVSRNEVPAILIEK